MPRGSDPDQLLRRSWAGDVDTLVQELVLHLKALGRPPAEPTGSPGERALSASVPAPARPRLPSIPPGPPPLAQMAPVAVLPVPPPRSSVQPWRGEGARQAAQQPPSSKGAQPPPGTRVVAVIPEPPGQRASVLEAPASATALATEVPTPGSPVDVYLNGPRAIPSADRARIEPAAPGAVARTSSRPIESPGVREVPSNRGVTPFASESIVAAPAGAPAGFYQAPMVLSRSGLGLSPGERPARDHGVIRTHLMVPAEAPRKRDRRRRVGVGPLDPRDDLDFDARILAQITEDGVDALVPSTSSDSVATPGSGEAYLLQFDGDVLTYFDQTPLDVYNLSQLPIGGPMIVELRRVGPHYFIEYRPAICHGVVTQDFTACNGVKPGRGKVQLYAMSAGIMVAFDDPVWVENWYSITGSSGKHCGVMEVDGTLSLEVIDC